MAKTLGMMLAAGWLLAACAHAPRTAEGRATLEQQADNALSKMTMNDPSLRDVIERSAGYVVFPRVTEAGFVVGAAGGRGVVYEHGRPIGFATLNDVSAGVEVGGHTFAELIVVRDPWALTALKAGRLHFGGQMSATLVKGGAAGSTLFGRSGVAVFVQPEAGFMLNVSVTGQRIKFSG